MNKRQFIFKISNIQVDYMSNSWGKVSLIFEHESVVIFRSFKK